MLTVKAVKVILQSCRTQQKHIQSLVLNFSLPSKQYLKRQRKLKQAWEGVGLSLASIWTYNEEDLNKQTQILGGIQQKDERQWAPSIEESSKIKTLFILSVIRCWITLPREAGESPVHGDIQTLPGHRPEWPGLFDPGPAGEVVNWGLHSSQLP